MIVISRARDRIRSVPAAWRRQYEDGWKPTQRGDSRATYEKLLALDLETATAEDVQSIIGNDSWCQTRCDNCQKYVTDTVRVGEEPDHESATVYLCFPCARKIVDIIDGNLPGEAE